MTDRDEPKKGFKIVDRRRFDEAGHERTGPDVQKDTPTRVDPPDVPAKAPARAVATPTASDATAATSPATGSAIAGSAASGGAAAGSPVAGSAVAAQPEETTPSGLTFSIFLQSLAQQALMQLGLLAWPHGQRELHLEQARDTIDIVTLLKSKTKGNLNAEEGQLMDTVVHELRLSFVEVQNAIARSKGQQMPPPPGAR